MTTTGLLVLIGLLACTRGAALLWPELRVRSFWVKFILLAVLALTINYATHHLDADEAMHTVEIRYSVAAMVGLLFILMIPNGDEGVWSDDLKKSMLEYVDSILIAGVTALFLIWFVVRSFYIPTGSMEPTLQVNDMLLVDELVYHFYRPARGDIVVFHPPPRAHSGDKDFIKRVVAVEGETVQIKNGKAYINGQPIDEPYTNSNDSDAWQPFSPITVPPGQVFCMGDNRNNSDDSRFWGTLPVENIVGKAFVIFWPSDRIRILH